MCNLSLKKIINKCSFFYLIYIFIHISTFNNMKHKICMHNSWSDLVSNSVFPLSININYALSYNRLLSRDNLSWTVSSQKSAKMSKLSEVSGYFFTLIEKWITLFHFLTFWIRTSAKSMHLKLKMTLWMYKKIASLYLRNQF